MKFREIQLFAQGCAAGQGQSRMTPDDLKESNPNNTGREQWNIIRATAIFSFLYIKKVPLSLNIDSLLIQHNLIIS